MKKQRKMAAKKILVIVGPTASGKSDLAVRLARKLKGEIISADSRQVYKGLDVGSGKITRDEMKGVPHHLIDVADPKKTFTAAQFKKMAEEELRYIEGRGRLPIVVGGTGFYIDALTGAARLPEVPPNKKLREKLSTKTNDALFRELAKKDPRRAKTIDPNNKVRLIRALEIVAALGKVPVEKSVADARFQFIGLNPPDLDLRIRKRLRKRLPAMIEEAKRLRKHGLSYKRMEELGLEYRYLARHLKGKMSKEEMVAQLETAIRHYAKRQMTWFKRNKKITWYESADDAYRASARLLG